MLPVLQSLEYRQFIRRRTSMTPEDKRYAEKIKAYILGNYKNNFREPAPNLSHPYLVPGAAYSRQLWDWDSWLTGYALLAIDDPSIEAYEKGCVLNFLEAQDEQGRIPILVQDTHWYLFDLDPRVFTNIHKPCLALHAIAISKHYGGATWLKGGFSKMEKFIEYYEKHQRDDETGLFFPIDDLGLGFDNDPTAFYRPKCSSATIYLNSLMQAEYQAMADLAEMLKLTEEKQKYQDKANSLAKAIRDELFDERDGFFYSADISLRKVDPNEWLQIGAPRHYHSLPMRIETWAGLLPLWSKIATPEQARRVVEEHYTNPSTLYSPYGIRSVSKAEKMFRNIKSDNPSCWSGPIWINANYFTYVGLRNYGYNNLAEDLALKTIRLLGKDVEENGQFYEYYHSETGQGLCNQGFQSWNFLVLLMIQDLEKAE